MNEKNDDKEAQLPGRTKDISSHLQSDSQNMPKKKHERESPLSKKEKVPTPWSSDAEMNKESVGKEERLPARVPDKPESEDERLKISKKWGLKNVLAIFIIVVCLVLVIIIFQPQKGKTHKLKTRGISSIEVVPKRDLKNKVIWFTLHNKKDKADKPHTEMFAIIGKDCAGTEVILGRHNTLKLLGKVVAGSSLTFELNCYELRDIDSLYFYFQDFPDNEKRGPIRLSVQDMCMR